jgi:7-keto-8-aminopelargonate synthetase-like enzyme
VKSFCGVDYLGMSQHKSVIDAMMATVARMGAGAGVRATSQAVPVVNLIGLTADAESRNASVL